MSRSKSKSKSKVVKTLKKAAKKLKSGVVSAARDVVKEVMSGNAVGTSSTLGKLSKRSKDPFPPRMSCKLYYNDVITLTGPATNLASEYIYCLNSLFDTDTSGGGHQPYCFDTMALLYTAYMVNACQVELEFFDPSADGCIVGYQVQGNAVSGSTASALQERPWVDSADISNTGNQRHCFRIYLPIHQVLGLKKAQVQNDTTGYGAAVSASPVGLAFIRLFCLSTIAATATTIKVNVKLTFYSTFWNRVSQAQS